MEYGEQPLVSEVLLYYLSILCILYFKLCVVGGGIYICFLVSFKNTLKFYKEKEHVLHSHIVQKVQDPSIAFLGCVTM